MLDIRKSEKGEGAEVLVQWVGLSDLESTWEPLATLVQQFPNFDPEDKVSLLRGSIDRLRIPLACMIRRLRAVGKKARVWEKFLKNIFKSG